MGKPFLKLIKDIADHQAHRTSGAVNAHTQGVHTEEPPPLEFRNKAYLHNIALVHVSLISTIMRRVLGHTVTSTRWNGAEHATQAAEFYRNPTAVMITMACRFYVKFDICCVMQLFRRNYK